MSMHFPHSGDLVNLNVGGQRFSTSRQTLTWIPDTFFTALLSGRISSLRDETGAIFIDRDPALFSIILNYLRTKEINIKNCQISALRHESEYYGLAPLVKRLTLCEDLNHSSCGDVLFYGFLKAPPIPPNNNNIVINQEAAAAVESSSASTAASTSNTNATSTNYSNNNTNNTNNNGNQNPSSSSSATASSSSSSNTEALPTPAHSNQPSTSSSSGLSGMGTSGLNARPGSMVRVPESSNMAANRHASHSRNSSWDLRGANRNSSNANTGGHSANEMNSQMIGTGGRCWPSSNLRGNEHSRNNSGTMDLVRHSRNSSADLNKLVRNDVGLVFSPTLCSNWTDPLRVQIIKAHQNWFAVAYGHFVACYCVKDSNGWQLVFTSPYIESTIECIAINTKVHMSSNDSVPCRMVAISYGSEIRLWSIYGGGYKSDIGTFNLNVRVEYLFFISSQLVALSSTGKIGVWHAMTQHWQIQDLVPVLSFDWASSFLLLGCNNGSIYYIDMQKFPLRMKDNDLLVTELYKDPNLDPITAISVYLTPRISSICGNWIEIAYGTKSGAVRIIVQHPETAGHGPHLFETFTVHQSPVTKVMLSEKYLVSVCSEYHHVRTWSLTRFRGMLSTQPGSTPEASFKIVLLEGTDLNYSYAAGNDFGPYGDYSEQIFVQKVIPETDQLYVRLASNGERVCVIKSVDGSAITSFCVLECEVSSRMGSRFILTGHCNGNIQMWDLTTAFALFFKREENMQRDSKSIGGPDTTELLKLLDQCEISNSLCSTPCISPCPSTVGVLANSTNVARMKASNLALLNQNGQSSASTVNLQQQQQQQQQPSHQQHHNLVAVCRGPGPAGAGGGAAGGGGNLCE